MTKIIHLINTFCPPQHIFSLEQEEYKREGVDWTEIKYRDNRPLLVSAISYLTFTQFQKMASPLCKLFTSS